MRHDNRFQVIFISPNGIRWYVYTNSPYVKLLNWAIKGIAKEEEYVTR